MGGHFAILPLLLAFASSQVLWNEEGRCGPEFPLADGSPGQCDPAGDGPRQGPCCSPKGFCGNSKNHCKCPTCIDYSKVTTTAAPVTPASVLRAAVGSEDDPQVRVDEGVLRGRQQGAVLEFWGVPFAAPPTGRLRFQRPAPAAPWRGLREAGTPGPMCPQISVLGPTKGEVVGEEDCLYLNIFTKDLAPSRPKAVMVWIHGGGFQNGAGATYLPNKLVEEDVVVVTINYRLGSLGFLTFANRLVAGNMGLWDQHAAIAWVRRNIEKFGGDKDRVTIFGESAGGMSVHAQVLSPKNHGHLAGAIAQSGTMLAQYDTAGSTIRMQAQAKRLLAEMECGSRINLDALSCLQDVPMKKLVAATTAADLDLTAEVAPYDWSPVVDSYSSDPFLPLSPLQAMQQGIFNRIPFISGTIENDGNLFVPFLTPLAGTPGLVPAVAGIFPIKSQLEALTKRHSSVANIIWRYYNHPSETHSLNQCLSDMLTDGFFFVPDQISVRLMSKFSDHVYNYQVTQKNEKSILTKFFDLDIDPTLNPGHGDEIPYLFEYGGVGVALSEEEEALSEAMVGLWTTFAKTGRPSTPDIDWLPTTPDHSRLLNLTDTSSAMVEGLKEEGKLLWDGLVWGPREERNSRRILYTKATALLRSGGAVIKK